MDLPALFLVGFMIALGRMQQSLLLLVQLDLLQPLIDTGLVFVVKRRSLLRRTALFIQIRHRNLPTVLVLGDANQIADFHFFTRLATLAVDMYFAAIDCIGGQASRLEKTRGPQPFIDADLV